MTARSCRAKAQPPNIYSINLIVCLLSSQSHESLGLCGRGAVAQCSRAEIYSRAGSSVALADADAAGRILCRPDWRSLGRCLSPSLLVVVGDDTASANPQNRFARPSVSHFVDRLASERSLMDAARLRQRIANGLYARRRRRLCPAAIRRSAGQRSSLWVSLGTERTMRMNPMRCL